MKIDVPERKKVRGLSAVGICFGKIVGITNDGRPMVDFPGNSIVGLVARAAVTCAKRPRVPPAGIPVVLAFEDGDPAAPVVVGMITAIFCPPSAGEVEEELVFEAGRQISLRCGKSVVTLRRDGKIVIRGAEVITRASGRNKIRGSSVEIN